MTSGIDRQNLFQDIKAVIICGICGFSKVSGEIIHRNINNLGGEASFSLSDIPIPDFIIAPNEIPLNEIIHALGISEEQVNMLKFVDYNWAIQSYTSKQLKNPDSYPCNIVKPVSQKRQPPEDENFSLTWPTKRMKTNLQHSNTHEIDIDPPIADILKGIKSEAKGHVARGQFVASTTQPTVSQKNQDFWESRKGTFQFAADKDYKRNLNTNITEVLEKLQNYYELVNDTGRQFAYRDAVSRIRNFPEEITSSLQLEGKYKIGPALKKKVDEILETGTLQRWENMKEQSYFKTVSRFCGIWGVGTSTANKLYQLNYRCIEDIRINIPIWFNDSQRVGLQFYEEFQHKIPREEVGRLFEVVERTSLQLAGDRKLSAIPCGSYRRGRELCGDIDILMTFEDMQPAGDFLQRVLAELRQSGFLTHDLTMPHFEHDSSHELYAGVCQVTPKHVHRRIDIKLYPREAFAWALLHFTGSANFNRSMRLFAKKLGYTMGDSGIYPTVRSNESSVKLASNVVCYSEEDIFAFFDVPFKAPTDRDI